jgi:predicted nuclease of predicted toxin-antitoxin system
MELAPAFKVDENLPVEVADYLRHAGYDARTVWEEGITGASDAVLAEVCQSEKRVLLTLDTDFSDIRAYPPEQFSGLVVLRLRRQDKPSVLKVIARLIPFFRVEPIVGRLWIVEEERFRIRAGGSK